MNSEAVKCSKMCFGVWGVGSGGGRGVAPILTMLWIHIRAHQRGPWNTSFSCLFRLLAAIRRPCHLGRVCWPNSSCVSAFRSHTLLLLLSSGFSQKESLTRIPTQRQQLQLPCSKSRLDQIDREKQAKLASVFRVPSFLGNKPQTQHSVWFHWRVFHPEVI